MLTYKSKTGVEYKTPANTDGLGTQSKLKRNGDPVNGVAILTGPTPDLLFLAMRLPPDLAGLASAIMHEVEVDAAAARN